MSHNLEMRPLGNLLSVCLSVDSDMLPVSLTLLLLWVYKKHNLTRLQMRPMRTTGNSNWTVMEKRLNYWHKMRPNC